MGVEGARHKEAEGPLGIGEEAADGLQEVLVQKRPNRRLHEPGHRLVLKPEPQRRLLRPEPRLEPLRQRHSQLCPWPPLRRGGLELLLGLRSHGPELRRRGRREVTSELSGKNPHYNRAEIGSINVKVILKILHSKNRAFTCETVGIA